MAKKKNKNIDLVMLQGKELVEFYRNNPCIAAYDLLGVDLAPIQRLVFEDMWFKNYVIAVAGRGFGKSFTLGTFAALACLLYPGYRVGLIAPVFRQSKMIFAEVEKLWNKSALFREATEKPPIRGSDTCYVKFKSIGGQNPSYIEALPLGDGNKIRGSRFYLILIDELAQVPDKILDLVLRPMGATKQDPMANVRKIEQQNKLIELGLATADDFEDDTVNKMIMTSSGYYKFNHMWRRMKSYWQAMEQEGENSQYAVWQVPYWDLPEGFLDMANIEEARRVMSNSEFRMEYEAEMISDSEGFFKASMLDDCTFGSGFSISLKGDKTGQYIIGMDPNQGGDASCGIVVIRIGQVNKIVNLLELKKKTTQELTMAVQDICAKYNVVRIFMDKGGGGKAVMDLLEEGYNGKEPILDRDNDDNLNKKGRHILEMINFNTSWITDANFTTLSYLEDKKLLFPEPPTSTADLAGKAYESITTLKSQMLNIVVTQTPSGALHFDTPKKGQNKDLYSALICAAYGARCIEKELEMDGDPVLHNSSGCVRPHGQQEHWRVFDGHGRVVSSSHMASAVLKKRK